MQNLTAAEEDLARAEEKDDDVEVMEAVLQALSTVLQREPIPAQKWVVFLMRMGHHFIRRLPDPWDDRAALTRAMNAESSSSSDDEDEEELAKTITKDHQGNIKRKAGASRATFMKALVRMQKLRSTNRTDKSPEKESTLASLRPTVVPKPSTLVRANSMRKTAQSPKKKKEEAVAAATPNLVRQALASAVKGKSPTHRNTREVAGTPDKEELKAALRQGSAADEQATSIATMLLSNPELNRASQDFSMRTGPQAFLPPSASELSVAEETKMSALSLEEKEALSASLAQKPLSRMQIAIARVMDQVVRTGMCDRNMQYTTGLPFSLLLFSQRHGVGTYGMDFLAKGLPEGKSCVVEQVVMGETNLMTWCVAAELTPGS